MNKIRKGDEVIVLAGRDKGKRGKSRRCAKMILTWWLRASILVKKHSPTQSTSRVRHGWCRSIRPCLSISPTLLSSMLLAGKADRVGIKLLGRW